MADKKVILEVELIEGNANSKLNELKASLQSLDKTHKDYKPTLQLIAQAERELAKAQQNRILAEKGLAGSTVKVEKATKKTAKQMKQLSSDTGASTSATLELGRVFSDAPYGIRGVANNIQQLASNLFFMSKKTNEVTGKTVGFKGAIGSLLKNLIGPAGILVAFQAGIALLDYLKGGMSSAGSSADDFKESIEDLTKTIDELNLSQDEAINKTKEYIEFKVLSVKLNKEIADSTEKMADLDDDIADNKAYILKREKQLYGELTKAQYHALSEEEKIAAKKRSQGALNENSEEMLAKKIKETSDLEKKRLALYKSTSKNVKELSDSKDVLNDADEDSLKGLKKLKREREKEREVLSKNSEKYRELSISIDNYKKKIEEIEGKDVRNKVDVLGLDSIDIGETKKKMERILGIVADGLNIDLKKDPLKIAPELDLEISDEAKKKIADDLRRQLNEILFDSKLEKAKLALSATKELLSGMTDFVSGEFEREMAIEQNKTNALNTELNNRLMNENLSKEQRASIQNEIAQNDELLRIKQESINRKKFKQEKAFNISMALIDTAAAAAATLKETKGGSFARIAGMIAVVGAGLAQVATISRQKYQSSSANTPINVGGSSGGGASSERAEPSFNVVGRSGDSLLLNAIQAQFDKPLKAYVVSRDVTNQQQLDGIISSESGT